MWWGLAHCSSGGSSRSGDARSGQMVPPPPSEKLKIEHPPFSAQKRWTSGTFASFFQNSATGSSLTSSHWSIYISFFIVNSVSKAIRVWFLVAMMRVSWFGLQAAPKTPFSIWPIFSDPAFVDLMMSPPWQIIIKDSSSRMYLKCAIFSVSGISVEISPIYWIWCVCILFIHLHQIKALKQDYMHTLL